MVCVTSIWRSVRRISGAAGFVAQGYGEWLRDYALTPIDVGVHPLRADEPQGEGDALPTKKFIARWKRVSQDFPT